MCRAGLAGFFPLSTAVLSPTDPFSAAAPLTAVTLLAASPASCTFASFPVSVTAGAVG